MNNEKNWLHYYKSSLFDSENLAIDISRIKNLFHQKNSDLSNALLNSKNANVLLDAEERRINRLKGITKKDSTNWHKVTEAEILIAPFHLTYQTDNPKFKQRIIHPFWVAAKVDRSGNLTPPKELFPLVVRNFLAPIADVKNDFIFSSIDTVIDAQDIEMPRADEEENIGWDVYWDYINEVFLEITKTNLNTYKTDRYTTQFELTYFATSAKISTAKSILFVYDNLINETENTPLLSKIITPVNRDNREAITNNGFLNYNHLHLGQMSNEFPLSITQRKTLLSYLTAEENAVMAVNGPPGTGKTTLLQSLVATEFVKAAIKGEDAPVILACSNNNQAVTNIIDSFINSESSLEELSERWVPDFHGYATYLPSSSKSEKALKNINFLKGNLFGHEGTLCDLENEQYLIEAENYFLLKFNTYFNQNLHTLEDACNHLQEEIFNIEDKLIDSVEFPSNYLTAIKQINKQLNNEADFIKNYSLEITKLQGWRNELTELKALENNPDFLEKIKSYFSFETSSDKTFKIDKSTAEDKKQASNFLKQLINQINIALQTNLKLKNWKFENNIKGFPSTSEEEMWENEYQKLASNKIEHKFYYDELDVNLRHKAFLLAVHYWEARWILETTDVLENETEKGTGEHIIRAKWKRRAMLTPCFVATFYTAPSHFVYSQFQGENEEGRPIFQYFPLYNFLDLLIIDEAGQVTPEVSIPMFAVAQKAFVIGDLKQIEPIWSIPPKIDIGNLSSSEVIQNPNEYEYLKNIGFLASNGSIMKMAQNACEYVTTLQDQKEQGLILLEHRRCNDEIIGFCNELAYNGILKPMKGKAKEDQIFPSMAAYHVNGVSERKYNSRCNINEVKAITTWLQQNKEHIKNAYNVEDIESVLGIITPFASQKGELSKALSEAGYKINDIKLGTVHALQGAERNIILFSSVYSNEDEGTMFFDKDNKPNMLNVAVSRAKDSFLLFGDTRILDETQNTPSGVLKKHLEVFEM
ncbi:hypothetical protein WH52_00080 [Tenacibaculum holothuriorum]|uniref:DNA2/NAM7 helicase-like C-terminal domain-containing protein n=1 Tax=Tenacibaculum holothuriorum TaxID=1635173 RepID=A0A1Y2PF17_9FLAO|nr:AAA domain-containing protein [Tenacibaculum holothuriorum]OSY89096.1 hypothetical protein WH52_00080 [Tenacibaculum holothuriorum]